MLHTVRPKNTACHPRVPRSSLRAMACLLFASVMVAFAGHAQPSPQGPGQGRGPAASESWLTYRAMELDGNADAIVTRDEVLEHARNTITALDVDKDGRLSREERDRRDENGPRLPLGGYLRNRGNEVDTDQDGFISSAELLNECQRLFDDVDKDHNGQLTAGEYSADARPPGGRGGRAGGDQGNNAQGIGQGGGQRGGGGGEGGGGQGGSRTGQSVEAVTVPTEPLNLLLGRPEKDSVTISAWATQDIEGYYAYGPEIDRLDRRTDTITIKAGGVLNTVLPALSPNARYYYQARFRDNHGKDLDVREGTFHTARAPGSTFTFAIQADSHLDENTSPRVYLQTLQNMGENTLDFLIDLGDTFMVDKHVNLEAAAKQYPAQRYYFGQVSHSAPLFLVLGNHDGEWGRRFDGTKDSMAGWSNLIRKEFFPNPVPNAFYTGNTRPVAPLGLLEDYYAWVWGDALFVVLDPYWFTKGADRGPGGFWDRTLGEEQYQWLKRTLETSRAAFKFVFIHNLVGGADQTMRGGAEAASFFEWGGHELDGRYTFPENRPGWPAPIHQLLVDNHVAAVFHGHDHMFIRQERDGVVYQLLPQPGSARYGSTRSPEGYSYTSGDVVAGAGYARVTVSPAEAKLEFVQTRLPGDAAEGQENNTVAYSYVMKAQGNRGPAEARGNQGMTPAEREPSRDGVAPGSRPRGPGGEVGRVENPRGEGQGRGGPGADPRGGGPRGGEGQGPRGGAGQGPRPAPTPIQPSASVVAPGATPVEVRSDFQFTEGPANDGTGNVYFTDVRASRIYRWSPEDGVSLYRENTGGANGLYFDSAGRLLACAGEEGRIVSLAPDGTRIVIADQFNGKRFNKPNDLWVDPKGGIYFSDPNYGGGVLSQDGEHVYRLAPGASAPIRVIDDMVRPNGLIGTPAGNILYVSDHGAGATYKYAVNSDGTLSGKTLLTETGSDGMTLDNEGNVYLTNQGVWVFSPGGEKIDYIAVPVPPTNVTFGGRDGKTLFITARNAVYTLQMRVSGATRVNRAERALPDTGQNDSFTDIPGEDADYAINPPSFKNNGDGTVTDMLTGLMWQQTDGGEMTWPDARTYAESLTLGGHTDWRLPTNHELFNVVDHGRSKPAINTDYFTSSEAEYWWSADERVDDNSRAWVVNAGGGIGPHAKDETRSAGGTKAYHVLCVRGPKGPATDLCDNGDGTVTDHTTGLMWERDEAGTMAWESALSYCNSLALGGYEDWRLPNIKELRSINDETLVYPSVSLRQFPNAVPGLYWSSTTLQNHPERAWTVDFQYGLVSYNDKLEMLNLRAVRNAMVP